MKETIDLKYIDYSDITGNEKQQEQAAKIYTKIIETREEILKERCIVSPNGAHSTCEEESSLSCY